MVLFYGCGANETLRLIAEHIFSSQIMLAILDPQADLLRAYLVIGANIVVLLAFFIYAYKKKGLRG
jgi:hypothetical protein